MGLTETRDVGFHNKRTDEKLLNVCVSAQTVTAEQYLFSNASYKHGSLTV